MAGALLMPGRHPLKNTDTYGTSASHFDYLDEEDPR